MQVLCLHTPSMMGKKFNCTYCFFMLLRHFNCCRFPFQIPSYYNHSHFFVWLMFPCLWLHIFAFPAAVNVPLLLWHFSELSLGQLEIYYFMFFFLLQIGRQLNLLIKLELLSHTFFFLFYAENQFQYLQLYAVLYIERWKMFTEPSMLKIRT